MLIETHYLNALTKLVLATSWNNTKKRHSNNQRWTLGRSNKLFVFTFIEDNVEVSKMCFSNTMNIHEVM